MTPSDAQSSTTSPTSSTSSTSSAQLADAVFFGAVNSSYKLLPLPKSGKRRGKKVEGQVMDASREVFAGIHIPQEWRAKINGDLVVTRHPQGNLMLFTQSNWQSFTKALLGAGMNADSWRRIFFGNALHVTIDRSGFVNIPARLGQRAGLTDQTAKATLIGVGKVIEIWESSMLEAVQLKAQSEMDTRAIDCLVF